MSLKFFFKHVNENMFEKRKTNSIELKIKGEICLVYFLLSFSLHKNFIWFNFLLLKWKRLSSYVHRYTISFFKMNIFLRLSGCQFHSLITIYFIHRFMFGFFLFISLHTERLSIFMHREKRFHRYYQFQHHRLSGEGKKNKHTYRCGYPKKWYLGKAF